MKGTLDRLQVERLKTNLAYAIEMTSPDDFVVLEDTTKSGASGTVRRIVVEYLLR